MKLALWLTVALVTLFWTGGVGFAAWLLGLVGDWASSTPGGLPTASVPAWLALWIDPALLHAMLAGLQDMLDGLQYAVPWAEHVLEVLVALVWVVWGFGVVALLGLAFGAHLLIGRLNRRATPAVAA